MKNHIKFIAGLSALFAVSAATAQDNVTKPVGFRTESIKAGVFNLISNQLTEAVSAAGAFTALDGVTAADDNADFTTSLAGEETWIVQITSGAAAGTISEVAAVASATSITTNDDLQAAGVVAEDTYEIRAAKTLADIFGAANEAGLVSGATLPSSDAIWVPNGVGGFDIYFYKTGGLGGSGWRLSTSLTADASLATIVYTDSFFIQKQAGADLDLVLIGHVPTRAATVPLLTGFNFISNVAVVGGTLNATGLLDQLQRGPTTAASDIVWLTNPAVPGGYLQYFPKEGGLGGSGWRLSTSLTADAGDAPLTSGVIIQRRGAPANANVGLPDFYADL
jgi:hypothetical protein